MKQILFTVFFVLIIGSVSFGQFSFGPRFGINLGSISDDPDAPSAYKQSNIVGLIFGASAEIGIFGPMYIDVQPTYIKKGEEIEGPFIVNGQQVNGTLTQTANYLQFPILIKAKFPAGPVKPYGFLGPNIGINLSATTEFEGGGQNIDQDNENASSIDFAVDFGAGIGFGIMPLMDLVFDVRYSLGLSNVIKNPQQNESAKTRGIQIMIGAMFGL